MTNLYSFCIFYFVRSGYVYLPGNSGGTFWLAGVDGYGWSSRGTSTRRDGAAIPSGRHLYFNTTGVNPSAGPNERFHAFPLRCLSTVLVHIKWPTSFPCNYFTFDVL